MLAGAGGVALGETCAESKLQYLFAQFKSLDEQVRAFQSGKKPVVKLWKQELTLFKIERENRVDPEIYSRRTRMDDGKWVTVQMRRWKGSVVDRTVLEIFDDKGRAIASVNDTNCDTGNLVISKQERQEGKAAIIQGALQAVTGREYRIVVRD